MEFRIGCWSTRGIKAGVIRGCSKFAAVQMNAELITRLLAGYQLSIKPTRPSCKNHPNIQHRYVFSDLIKLLYTLKTRFSTNKINKQISKNRGVH